VPSEGRLRLDLALVHRGLAAGRAQAQAAVLAGEVLVDGRRASKPGQSVAPSSQLEMQRRPQAASRGAGKLEAALGRFAVDPTGLVCLDIGASTGGFTDTLLQHGAQRVYAVDVGYGQLLWRLRQDRRVCVLERTNARRLSRAEVPEPIGLAVFDVSFISLGKVTPPALALLSTVGAVIALVKPQFEAGPRDVPRGGVVRDPMIHRRVLEEVSHTLQAQGLGLLGLMPSPVRGASGNQEFLWYGAPWASKVLDAGRQIDQALAEAHGFQEG